jgi:uncharacterized protein (DUF2252 family)
MNTVSERIKKFNAHLLPDKVRFKYELLSEDAFRFFRGTNHLFYEDLSKVSLISSPAAWLCGDLHLENFGSYKGDNRLVYFDINDFDESILAPVSYDLVRMITSIFVGFEALNISKEKAADWAGRFLQTYTSFLAKGKSRNVEIQIAKGPVRDFLEQVSGRTQKELLRKRVRIKNGKILFKTDEKKYLKLDDGGLVHDLGKEIFSWTEKQRKKLKSAKLVDACFRIAGTGSVGVKRYMLLIRLGVDKKRYRLLDMKQVMPSSLQPFIQIKQPAWNSEAERSVSLKFILKHVPPALLDTITFRGEAFSLQELQPSEDKINFSLIRNNYADLNIVLYTMAMLTASTHIRGSGRNGSAIADELIAFAKEDHWQRELIDYARDYSEQVKNDYQSFLSDYNNKVFD